MTGSPDAYQKGYQRALDDFGVSPLLERLSNFSDPDFDAHWLHWQEKELESLAALLIQQLTDNLKGSFVADYLNTLRHENGKVISSQPFIDFHLLQSIELPADRSIPLFWVGDRLSWKPIKGEVETDFGVVLGRFYLPAPHRGFQWSWKYLVLLDKNSPSFAITTADTAWEEDLEQREEEAK